MDVQKKNKYPEKEYTIENIDGGRNTKYLILFKSYWNST